MSKINFKKIVASILLFFITFFLVVYSQFIIFSNRFNTDISSVFIQNNTKYNESILNNNVLYSKNDFNNVYTEQINSLDNFLDDNEIIKLNSKKEVYLGGIPVGIKVGANGVIVTGFNEINDLGRSNPFKNTLVQIGDVIEKINGKKITCIKDLEQVVNLENGEIEILFRKNNQKYTINMTPIYDKKIGKNVLGLKVKDSVYGIGTLTYVDINKRFASLGHHIVDSSTGACNILNNGQIFNSYITGSTRGKNGVAGHLNGMIVEENKLGSVDKNINFGLYGVSNDNIIKGLKKIEVGSRDEVALGKAQILTTIEGIKPKLYDVEIVKVSRQNRPQERSMIVRVIDKELINKTGGIVQGMSGSPIIQNGKLIGALTHVFLNDSKKGFGLFIDWMLPN